MFTHTIAFLFWAAVAAIAAPGPVDISCGKHWSDFVNAGDTAYVALHYGVPGAIYTEGIPALAGCAPAAGYYSEGQAIAKVEFSYAEASMGHFPLVQRGKSNTTDLASHTVTYEAQLPGLEFALRPKTIDILESTDTTDNSTNSDPGHNVAEHTYDTKGRIVYINWTYSSATRSRLKKLTSPPHRFFGKPRGVGSPTNGYEKFVYGDADHPLHASFYESLDKDGYTAVGFKRRSNAQGLLTDVESVHFEEATCPDGCAAPNSCCKDIGSNDSGTCFNVPCAELGGTAWHYEYDSNARVTAMTESTRVNGVMTNIPQSYTYDSLGRLTAYSQPASPTKNDTIFTATYDGTHIKMMVLFIIYPIFPEIWGFDPPSPIDAEARFEDFINRFGRQYKSVEERAHRFQVFVSNLNLIEATNAKSLPYTLGVTSFADMTFAEWRSQFVGGLKLVNSSVGLKSHGVFRVPEGFVEPDAVDWAAKGAVTKVKDQGTCGSCWTFATTGALEGALFVAGRKLVDLSQQQILDCDKSGSRCQGGNLDQAFTWVQENGICADSDDSYKCANATSAECLNATCNAKCTKVIGIGDVLGKTDVDHTENALEAAVAQQPVAVAIEGDKPVFQHYVSGVLTSDACGTSLDHGVLVVGYGTDHGQKYWKVKNSWSSSYGEQGYIRLARGKAAEGGECGIRSMASFPTVRSGVEIVI